MKTFKNTKVPKRAYSRQTCTTLSPSSERASVRIVSYLWILQSDITEYHSKQSSFKSKGIVILNTCWGLKGRNCLCSSNKAFNCGWLMPKYIFCTEYHHRPCMSLTALKYLSDLSLATSSFWMRLSPWQCSLMSRLPDGKIWSLPFLGLRQGGGRGGAIQGKEGIKFCSVA